MNIDNKQKLTIFAIIVLTIFVAIALIFIALKISFVNYFSASLLLSIGGGMIGGALYMGRGFYQSVAETEKDERKFNFNRWIWWYLLRPFLSAIAGAVLFLIVYIAVNLQETTQNQIVFFVLGLLAGYNFHDFAENKLGILSKSVLTKK